MTITLKIHNEDFIRGAAAFTAQLAREGVTFTAVEDHGKLIITFDGGF